jgi:hypothetical protein
MNDESLLAAVINEDTTEPDLVSTLTVLKQEQAANLEISETCDNGVDDNGSGTIATAYDEGCAPTTNTSANTTDTNTNTNTNANTTNTNTNANTTNTNTNASTTTPPASEICDIGADNSTEGTIASTSNEGCTPTTTTPVSDTCDNGIDNNVTDTTNGTTTIACTPPASDTCDNVIDNNVTDTINCPILEPTVVIDSAVDQLGNPLSPGDLISPQEVTFTFSTQTNETTQNLEEEGAQDYQYECALDEESFSSCNSPMTYEMEAGKHDFVVRLVS